MNGLVAVSCFINATPMSYHCVKLVFNFYIIDMKCVIGSFICASKYVPKIKLLLSYSQFLVLKCNELSIN